MAQQILFPNAAVLVTSGWSNSAGDAAESFGDDDNSTGTNNTTADQTIILRMDNTTFPSSDIVTSIEGFVTVTAGGKGAAAYQAKLFDADEVLLVASNLGVNAGVSNAQQAITAYTEEVNGAFVDGIYMQINTILQTQCFFTGARIVITHEPVSVTSVSATGKITISSGKVNLTSGKLIL